VPGYPDYQAYPSWRGGNAFPAFQQTFAPGNNLSGVQSVNIWRGAQVRVFPDNATAGFARVILSWYSDAVKTHLLGSDNWGVNVNTALDVLVPIKGPFAEVNIDVTSVGAMDASAQFVPTNVGDGHISYPVTNDNAHNTGVAVVASGTSDLILPLVQGGLASVNFTPVDALGKLTFIVAVYKEDGTFNYQLHNYGQPTAPVNDRVILPDDIAGIHVINTDGAGPHSYSARISAGGSR
jgi:hypothetical protein